MGTPALRMQVAATLPRKALRIHRERGKSWRAEYPPFRSHNGISHQLRREARPSSAQFDTVKKAPISVGRTSKTVFIASVTPKVVTRYNLCFIAA